MNEKQFQKYQVLKCFWKFEFSNFFTFLFWTSHPNFLFPIHIPYARHHNPLLITNRSWILTIHKDRIFWENLLENKEMVFKNGVKNIQTAGYNWTRTQLAFLQKKVSRLDKRNFLHLMNECRGLDTWFLQITTPKIV